MMKAARIILVSFFGWASSLLWEPVFAEELSQPAWSGEGELGYTRTTGNTDTESLLVKLAFKRETEDWRIGLRLEDVTKKQNDQRTADRFYMAFKGDYKLAARHYLFASADYENDRFSGFDYRANIATGYGYRVVDLDMLDIDVEIGPGLRRNKRVSESADTEATARLAGNLVWIISPTAKFTSESSAVRGESDTVYRALNVLTTRINSYLSLRVSHLYKHASDVPLGTKKTDTETAVTLVYSF